MTAGVGRDPTILITGASGFIGGEVVRRCEVEGIKFRALSRRRPANRHWIIGDIRDSHLLYRAFDGVDAFIHCAGLAHSGKGAGVTMEMFRTNTVGTRLVVAAARHEGVPAGVVVSTVSVYGSTASPGMLVDENDRCQPRGPYAVSKLLAEHGCEPVHGALAIRVLRFATVYGDERDPGNLGRLIRAIDRRRFLPVGSGRNRKSFLHVADAASACLRSLASDVPAGIFNVVGDVRPINETVGLIAQALGRSIPPRMPTPVALAIARAAKVAGRVSRPADQLAETLLTLVRDDAYDGSRFESAASFAPAFSHEQGIAAVVETFRRSGLVAR